MGVPGEGGHPVEGGLGFTELASEDPEQTQRFLEAVFGWKFRAVPMPGGQYLSAEGPGGRAGIRSVRPSEPASSLAYVQVNDLDRALARVQQAGGTVVLPRVDVPGMGCFFWFRVPGGPIMACWQDLPTGTGRKEKGRK
ncbi:MAG TPA: VOC family protein [Thermoplasmata archaeon]|nr:VOC family protein [Thermoplasmata archaeon]